MAKGAIDVVFKCVVCGRVWGGRQSLRAHMKVHRREGYVTTHIVVRLESWRRFRGVCERHKTTACSLLGALIDAAVKGDDLGVIRVGSENPAIIQVVQHFIGKPRGSGKVQYEGLVGYPRGSRCPECGSVDVYEFEPMGLGYLDGRCRRCRAQWLIKPSIQPEESGKA